jgi:hypothetical protein
MLMYTLAERSQSDGSALRPLAVKGDDLRRLAVDRDVADVDAGPARLGRQKVFADDEGAEAATVHAARVEAEGVVLNVEALALPVPVSGAVSAYL